MDPQLLLVSSDLILLSQIEAPARAAGFAVAVVSSVEAISSALASARPELVVLDLADSAVSFDATLRMVRETAPEARVLAFYPHVRDELRRNAEAAGCDVVIPRSRFLTQTAGVLRQALDSGAQQ